MRDYPVVLFDGAREGCAGCFAGADEAPARSMRRAAVTASIVTAATVILSGVLGAVMNAAMARRRAA